MNEYHLPKHLAERVERRWASRLARDAAAWRGQKPPHAAPQMVTDRKGRLVAVAFKRTPVGRLV
jgi:hypothetical protein